MMEIAVSARCALGVCVALSMLAACGGGSSSLAPSAPSNGAGNAPAHHRSGEYERLYTFQGGADGVDPFGNLLYENGQLYGTTLNSAGNNDGTVFKISTSGTKVTLYSFQGGTDGAGPQAGLIAGSGGVLYGDTVFGGDAPGCSGGCGTVYELVPNGSGYTEKVIYAFQGGSDGSAPEANLLSDQSGALYGTTYAGGGAAACVNAYYSGGCGTVFKLTPSGSGFTETILYSFQGGNDGIGPSGTLIEDASGALYGTTGNGGGASACSSPSGNAGCGTVFKLAPSGSGYTESILYSFQGGVDGATSFSGLIAGSNGTLFGATHGGGANHNNGTVYELTPYASGYSKQTVFSFNGGDGKAPNDFNGLYADSHGNLYGTTKNGGERCSCGTVFKLSPSSSGYTETVLHKFKGPRNDDGRFPQASLTADSSGALYGTTGEGGLRKNHGYGIVFKISP